MSKSSIGRGPIFGDGYPGGPETRAGQWSGSDRNKFLRKEELEKKLFPDMYTGETETSLYPKRTVSNLTDLLPLDLSRLVVGGEVKKEPTVLDPEFDIAAAIDGEGFSDERKAGVVKVATRYRDSVAARLNKEQVSFAKKRFGNFNLGDLELEQHLEMTLRDLGQQRFVALVRIASSPISRYIPSFRVRDLEENNR